EVAENNWILAGIAVGTSQTHIGFYDTMGRTIREDDVPTPVAQLSEEDFIEHIMAGVNRLMTGLDRKLVSVGVTTSGTVDNEGRITASNLGWENVDIAERLRFQFGVPVVVSSAIPAILGSETQAAELGNTDPVLVLFADDSIGAALSANDEVSQIIPLPATSQLADPEESLTTAAVLRKLGRTGTLTEAVAAAANNPAERKILDDRARQLGEIAALLVNEYKPATVVVAGSAFLDDPAAPKLFAAAVREKAGRSTQLRVIPSLKEIVRAITRAIALDPLLRVPLELF
ncbi:TPA: ROK family protein, partial [Corynebacterium striatum]|nr:ROK family protein [Corynebacterium striatum]